MGSATTVATGAADTAGSPATVRRPGRSRLRATRRARAALAGWGFAAPFAVLFTVFLALPVIASLTMSVTDIRSTDVRNPFAVGFVGLDNYVKLFRDVQFGRAAVNTTVVVLFGLPLTIALGLLVAIGLNTGLVRLRGLFRIGYYLPVNTSIVAIAVVWRFLLQPESGPINNALSVIGIDGPNWLSSTTFAMPALIAMVVWRGIGFQMIIFLAGLQAIPKQLYEAASIDGAGWWAKLRHVTIPSLRPTLLFVSVMGTIGLVQVFEEPMVMTQGGPLESTTSVSLNIYRQFGFGNYGYASAMSYVLFVAIVLLALVWLRLLRPNDGSRS